MNGGVTVYDMEQRKKDTAFVLWLMKAHREDFQRYREEFEAQQREVSS